MRRTRTSNLEGGAIVVVSTGSCRGAYAIVASPYGDCAGRISSAPTYRESLGRHRSRNTGLTQQPSRGRSNVPTRACANDSDHIIAPTAFLQARGRMACHALLYTGCGQALFMSNRFHQGHPPNPASSHTSPSIIPSKSRVVPIASMPV